MKKQAFSRRNSLFALLTLTMAMGHSGMAVPWTPPKKLNVLFLTSFEAPTRHPTFGGLNLSYFKRGLLNGQNGFVTYGDNSIQAGKVVSGVAKLGKQSAFIDGSRLTFFDGDMEGYYYPTFDYDPMSEETPIITTFCDVMYKPHKKGEDYAGLGAYDIEGSEFGSMYLNADERLIFGGAEVRSIKVTKNRWHQLQMRLDFKSRQIQFSFDGRPLGVAAFGEDAGTRFGDADLLMESGDKPTPHKAYFDNFGIIASEDSSQNVQMNTRQMLLR